MGKSPELIGGCSEGVFQTAVLQPMLVLSDWFRKDGLNEGSALHRGNISASHPAAPGLIPGIPKKIILNFLTSPLLRVKWTEAWKCQSNPSSTGKWNASTTNKQTKTIVSMVSRSPWGRVGALRTGVRLPWWKFRGRTRCRRGSSAPGCRWTRARRSPGRKKAPV